MDAIRRGGSLRTVPAIIDADRETLIHLFNQVGHAAKHRAGKLVCNHILDKLIEHTKARFGLEEQLMTAYHYPNAARHKEEHATLIMQALQYRFEFGSIESQMPFLEFPKHWATFHMLTADKELSDFISGVAGRKAPARLSKSAHTAATKSATEIFRS